MKVPAVLRKVPVAGSITVLATLALTVAAAILVTRVEAGAPPRLPLGDGVLFLRGRWEIGLAWLLAVATVLLAARPRRRPRLALLALVPLLALAGWLFRPLLLAPHPDAVAFTSADQLAEADRKTLVVGVDAMSWSRILPLVEEGRLPNLAALMHRGSYGVLESLRTYRPSVKEMGYWSPVVWTTIATGRTEKAHGIVDFSLRTGKGNKRRMAASWHRRVPAFWNLFSAFHRPVGVVGWWASWPAEPVEGVMVSSSVGLRGHRQIRNFDLEDRRWFERRQHLTWPESYKEVILDQVGLPTGMDDWFDEHVFPYKTVPILSDEELETLLSVAWQDRLYLDVALHLLKTGNLSLYSVYFEGVDAVSHRFWQYVDPKAKAASNTASSDEELGPAGADAARQAVDRYYEVIDDYLGQLLAAAGEGTTVMVVSDHGFQAMPGHPRNADHSPHGVILLAGQGIRRGHDLDLSLPGSLADRIAGPASVLGVLPTLLYLNGLPVSAELDGKVLNRALERSYVSSRPELTVPTYGDFESTRQIDVNAADEDEYLERMRALGYIR